MFGNNEKLKKERKKGEKERGRERKVVIKRN